MDENSIFMRVELINNSNYFNSYFDRKQEIISQKKNYYQQQLLACESVIKRIQGNGRFDLSFLTKKVDELTTEERKFLIKAYSNLSKGNYDSWSQEELNVVIKASQKLLSKKLKDVEEEKDKYYELYSQVKKIENNMSFYALDKSCIDRSNIDTLKQIIEESTKQGLELYVVIDNVMLEQDNLSTPVNYTYSKKETELLLELNNCLCQNGQKELAFYEMDHIKYFEQYDLAWPFRAVANANSIVDKVLKEIKRLKLSPFEAVLKAHAYVSKFQYKYGNSLEAHSTLPGIFSTGTIICSGYASLMKAIIDKLGIKDLSCDLVGCKRKSAKGLASHCHNLIKIKDSKYGIDGYYLDDACQDSIAGGCFAHCLFPVGDLMENRFVKYASSDSKDRFSNLIADTNEIENNLLNSLSGKEYYTENKFINPKIVKQYGKFSNPIPCSSYIQALKVIYSSDKEIYQLMGEMKLKGAINRSMALAAYFFNDNAKNAFLTLSSKEHREKIRK